MEMFPQESLSPSNDKRERCNLHVWLAALCAGYALYVWPNLVVYYIVSQGLPVEAANGLLTYVTVIASGPIGLWVWVTNKDRKGS